MTISLLSDVMGSREKLQLAMSGCRDDTGCIETPVEFDGLSGAKRHYCSPAFAGLTDQQKVAPNRNRLQVAAAAAAAVSKYS
jgi:hypothetical protein